MSRHRVPGASVALMTDGELGPLWCHGTSDALRGCRVRPDTLFQAGSVSKLVTAIGLLTLVQDGVIDLDVDVDRYLRSWRVGQPVTARQLLRHTAGLTATGYDGYRPGEPVPSLLDILTGRWPAATPAVRVERPPGEQYRYSGSHYTVLQQLLLDVLAGSFADLMQSRVLAPLGMVDSTFHQEDHRVITRGALAHDGLGRRYPERWRVLPEQAAAGLWTTPADLVRLLGEVRRAVTGTRAVLLSRDSAATLLSDGAATAANQTLLLHSGGTPGFQCLALSEQDTGSGLVIMLNGDGGRDCIDEVRDHVLGRSGRGDRS